MLGLLNEPERRTLDAYVGTLRERLGERLLAVRVFGSVARGESWPEEQQLVEATFPPFADAVQVWPCR